MATTNILDRCIRQIETGKASVEQCVSRFPAYRRELERVLPLVARLTSARSVKPSLEFRQQSQERLMRRLPIRPKRAASFRASQGFVFQVQGRRVNMAWGLVLALVFSLVAGGGVVYASDQAAPGDVLYGLDRAIEDVQLDLTKDPSQVIRLQLDLAGERVEEIQKLKDGGDIALIGQALSDYGASISSALDQLELAPNQPEIESVIEVELAAHNQALAQVDDEEPIEEETTEPVAVQIRDRDRDCVCLPDSTYVHPVIDAIALEYELSYDDIAIWFCEGYGLGEIELALRISGATGDDLATILAMRDDGTGWGKIMQALDLIGGPQLQGPPDDAGPRDDGTTGKPETAGPRVDQENGPPDMAGPQNEDAVGPKENLETGPREQAGPKEENPGNAPADAGTGPSDDLQTGPPDNAGPKDETPPAGGSTGNGLDNGNKGK